MRALLVDDPIEEREQQLRLVLAADQRGRVRGARAPRPRTTARTASQAGTGSDLPFSSSGSSSTYSIAAPGEPVRELADDHRSRLGRGLQPRGDVDRVADHRVAVADPARRAPRPELIPTRSAKLGADVGGDPLVDLLHRALHRQPGAHRALGVVLVGHRGAEDAHHVVADVLVDRPAVALDLGRRAAAVRGRPATSSAPGRGARRPRCSRRGRRRSRSRCGAPPAAAPRRRRDARRRRRPRRARSRTRCRTSPRRGFSAPQVGHAAASVEPHDMQKRARSGFSVPQLGQVTVAGYAGSGADERLGRGRAPAALAATLHRPPTDEETQDLDPDPHDFAVLGALATRRHRVVAGCGGDDSSDVDPQTVIDETFSNEETGVERKPVAERRRLGRRRSGRKLRGQPQGPVPGRPGRSGGDPAARLDRLDQRRGRRGRA